MIATGILYALGIVLFRALIISAIASSATVFLGLAFAVAAVAAIPKINQKKGERKEKFFQKFKTICKSGDREKLEDLLEKLQLLRPSNEEIINFTEKQSEDDLGNTLLHEIVSQGNTSKDILSYIYVFFPDLNWGVQNKYSQTILHIIAEKEYEDLASQFCVFNCIIIDPYIKDFSGKTAKIITNEKKEQDVSLRSESNFYFYDSLYADLEIRCGYKESLSR